MANYFDYLQWRGDLPFSLVPPCEADKLILSQLSYIFFDGIVPELGTNESIPLGEAAQRVLDVSADIKEKQQVGYLWADDKKLLEHILSSPRYTDIPVANYRSVLLEDTQFAALTFALPNNLTCISFRGTDGSLVGWKEDCALAFSEPVPAQRISVDYVKQIAEITSDRLLVVGHSKGGNMACYACACVPEEVQDRIEAVVSCDGPGLDRSVLQMDGYRRIVSRVEKFVPQSSVVGMLLESEDNYTVIKSDGVGILQHYTSSWQIDRGSFQRVEQPTQTSRYINHVIKEWLDDMSVDKRRAFVNALFDILEKANLKSIDEIDARFFFNLPGAFLKSYAGEPETVSTLYHELRALVMTALKALSEGKPDGNTSLAPKQ